MNIEIISFTSPDILDLKTYIPYDKESFSFLLEMEIGANKIEGTSLFCIEVLTPKWLLDNHQAHDVVFGKHKLIVFEYNIDNIINSIKQYLKGLGKNSWEEAVVQISKIAHWEFEEYKS